MRDFFATPACDWRRPDGSLHLYLLPEGEQRAELARLQDALPWPDLHARQPASFLHATVLRLPWFLPELDEPQLTAVQESVAQALSAAPPFVLEFDTIALTDFGVVVSAPSTQGWESLLASLESALGRCDVQSERPDAGFSRPFGPHVSLSYGRADAGADELADVVATMSVRQSWPVRRLELLSVHMHRSEGTYSWEDVSSHTFVGEAADDQHLTKETS